MREYGLSEPYTFRKAVPVWEKGMENEMNHSLLFRGTFTGREPVTLSIAAHTRIQIFVNGRFFAAGPARAAHGFYRVSEYELSQGLNDGTNLIAVLAAGYNSNSYYLLDEPSFLCAEVSRAGKILLATGSDAPFTAIRYTAREKKVQRFSFQRPFTESWRLTAEQDRFFTDPQYDKGEKADLNAKTDEKKMIGRGVPYCRYDTIAAKAVIARYKREPAQTPKVFDDRSLLNIGKLLKGYKKEELTTCLTEECYRSTDRLTDEGVSPAENVMLPAGTSALFDMGKNTTGYISLRVRAEKDAVLYAVFNEILDDKNAGLDPGRMGCASVVKWQLAGGKTYDLLSFEPYTYRFLELIAEGSGFTVENVSQYRETYPEDKLVNLKKMPDGELQRIYDAAAETFVQNATDIFMDCPSRERAGWLCDSFFTARVEKELTGKSLVERCFLENFILPDSFPGVPDGMLPMCYPSDHPDGCYIPNWAMWYVIELAEYFDRTGDSELVLAAKQRVLKLIKFFEKYENADGLLEKLDSWIFVEWSAANSYVLDINYPTNMLYALCLESAAKLYGEEAFLEKAAARRKTINEKAFDGKFYHDRSVLNDDGQAVLTDDITETCQYYAFFTRTATKESRPELLECLIRDFGPDRLKTGKYHDIAVSNAFIGNYLRLQILFSERLYDRVEKEIRDFFLPMADKTGTLWENMSDHASCDHGFASYVAVLLNKLFG